MAASAPARTVLALFNLQYRQESLLWNLHRPHLLHAFLPLALLFEELALARDVAAVALRGDVLAERPDRFTRDHLRADRRLNHDLEQLARNQILQLLGDLPAPLVRLVAMNDNAKRVHRLPVEQHVELHELPGAVRQKLVVERGVPARDRLQLVVEIENDLGE